MKKLLLGVIAISFLFVSCVKDDDEEFEPTTPVEDELPLPKEPQNKE